MTILEFEEDIINKLETIESEILKLKDMIDNSENHKLDITLLEEGRQAVLEAMNKMDRWLNKVKDFKEIEDIVKDIK